MFTYLDPIGRAEVYYLYYSEWHSGGGSEEYRKLCLISRVLRPRPELSYATLEDEQRYLYDSLVLRKQGAAALARMHADMEE